MSDNVLAFSIKNIFSRISKGFSIVRNSFFKETQNSQENTSTNKANTTNNDLSLKESIQVTEVPLNNYEPSIVSHGFIENNNNLLKHKSSKNVSALLKQDKSSAYLESVNIPDNGNIIYPADDARHYSNKSLNKLKSFNNKSKNDTNRYFMATNYINPASNNESVVISNYNVNTNNAPKKMKSYHFNKPDNRSNLSGGSISSVDQYVKIPNEHNSSYNYKANNLPKSNAYNFKKMPIDGKKDIKSKVRNGNALDNNGDSPLLNSYKDDNSDAVSIEENVDNKIDNNNNFLGKKRYIDTFSENSRNIKDNKIINKSYLSNKTNTNNTLNTNNSNYLNSINNTNLTNNTNNTNNSKSPFTNYSNRSIKSYSINNNNNKSILNKSNNTFNKELDSSILSFNTRGRSIKTLEEIKKDLENKKESNKKFFEDLKTRDSEIRASEIEERKRILQIYSTMKNKLNDVVSNQAKLNKEKLKVFSFSVSSRKNAEEEVIAENNEKNKEKETSVNSINNKPISLVNNTPDTANKERTGFTLNFGKDEIKTSINNKASPSFSAFPSIFNTSTDKNKTLETSSTIFSNNETKSLFSNNKKTDEAKETNEVSKTSNKEGEKNDKEDNSKSLFSSSSTSIAPKASLFANTSYTSSNNITSISDKESNKNNGIFENTPISNNNGLFDNKNKSSLFESNNSTNPSLYTFKKDEKSDEGKSELTNDIKPLNMFSNKNSNSLFDTKNSSTELFSNNSIFNNTDKDKKEDKDEKKDIKPTPSLFNLSSANNTEKTVITDKSKDVENSKSTTSLWQPKITDSTKLFTYKSDKTEEEKKEDNKIAEKSGWLPKVSATADIFNYVHKDTSAIQKEEKKVQEDEKKEEVKFSASPSLYGNPFALNTNSTITPSFSFGDKKEENKNDKSEDDKKSQNSNFSFTGNAGTTTTPEVKDTSKEEKPNNNFFESTTKNSLFPSESLASTPNSLFNPSSLFNNANKTESTLFPISSTTNTIDLTGSIFNKQNETEEKNDSNASKPFTATDLKSKFGIKSKDKEDCKKDIQPTDFKSPLPISKIPGTSNSLFPSSITNTENVIKSKPLNLETPNANSLFDSRKESNASSEAKSTESKSLFSDSIGLSKSTKSLFGDSKLLESSANYNNSSSLFNSANNNSKSVLFQNTEAKSTNEAKNENKNDFNNTTPATPSIKPIFEFKHEESKSTLSNNNNPFLFPSTQPAATSNLFTSLSTNNNNSIFPGMSSNMNNINTNASAIHNPFNPSPTNSNKRRDQSMIQITNTNFGSEIGSFNPINNNSTPSNPFNTQNKSSYNPFNISNSMPNGTNTSFLNNNNSIMNNMNNMNNGMNSMNSGMNNNMSTGFGGNLLNNNSMNNNLMSNTTNLFGGIPSPLNNNTNNSTTNNIFGSSIKPTDSSFNMFSNNKVSLI